MPPNNVCEDVQGGVEAAVVDIRRAEIRAVVAKRIGGLYVQIGTGQ